MSLVFRELNEIEYEKFASSHQQANFLQSSYSGKRRIIDGWSMHLVGMVQDGKVVSSALLSYRKTLFGFYDFECQHGPLVDYDDEKMAVLFLKNIISYIKDNNGLGIRINPNIASGRYNSNDDVISSESGGAKYIKNIIKSGFLKINNRLVDDDPNLLRWYFKKDLSGIYNEKDILDSVSVKTRQDIQRSEKMGVTVKSIGIDDLDLFLKLMKSTGARRNFAIRDKSYYASLLESFGSSRAICLLAELDASKYIQYLNGRIRFEKAELELIKKKSEETLKIKSQVCDRESQIIELKERIKEFSKLGIKPVVMAGSIFIIYGSEMVYLSSGAYTEYSKFCSPYAIQFYAMKYAVQHKIPMYNFYGTGGSFSGHPDMDGLYNFKKGFNGYLEEQVGYFYKNVRPVSSFIIAVLRKIRKILG